MGERQNRTLEAVGSSPIGSINLRMKLEGKTALITGAARGIGAAIAERFAAAGANLLLTDLDGEKLAETAGKLEAGFMEADVTSEEDAKASVEKAIESFGSLEILVNNAGISRDSLLVRTKAKDFDDVLAVNLRGPFLMSRAAARPMMKARFGKIINISSVIGIRGNAGQMSYASSKGGLIAMTMSLAKELGGRGIRVNALAPGYIDTEMTSSLPESAIEYFESRVLLGGEAGAPGDVADAALFLASELSDYITGVILPVDGGMAIS